MHFFDLHATDMKINIPNKNVQSLCEHTVLLRVNLRDRPPHLTRLHRVHIGATRGLQFNRGRRVGRRRRRRARRHFLVVLDVELVAGVLEEGALARGHLGEELLLAGARLCLGCAREKKRLVASGKKAKLDLGSFSYCSIMEICKCIWIKDNIWKVLQK